MYEIENPQLISLFEAKMWDIFKLILDKCIHVKKNEADFSILDMPVKSVSNHPLMLIARSGQENLVKHPATLLLLNLKWRKVPRITFYSNLLFSTVFLALVIYMSYAVATNPCTTTTTNVLCSFDGNLYLALMIMIGINVIRGFFEFLFVDKIAYFLSFENWLEVSTYASIIVALHSNNDHLTAIQFGSWAVLSACITFPLYLQKLRVFGVYVVAILKTIKNSAKFFPIFFVMLTGFYMAFFMRYSFGMVLNNPNALPVIQYIMLRTLAIVIGDINTVSDAGLIPNSGVSPTPDSGYLLNYFIWLIFLVLMCLVMYNLFIGIAVSDITSVLSEADIRFLTLRITYVLTIQAFLEPVFSKSLFFHNFLGMNFQDYKQDSEYMTQLNRRIHKLIKLFSTKEEKILLEDPQKRLEDSIHKMFKNTENDTQSIEKLFKSQFESMEVKFSNSNKQLQSNLLELSISTMTSFDNVKQEMAKTNKNFNEKLRVIDLNIHSLGDDLKNIPASKGAKSTLDIKPMETMIEPSQIDQDKFDEANKMLENNLNEKFSNVENKMNEVQIKFETELIGLKSQINYFIKSLNESLKTQTTEIQNALFLSETSVRSDLNESIIITGKGINLLKENAAKLEGKFDQFQRELKELNESVAAIKQ